VKALGHKSIALMIDNGVRQCAHSCMQSVPKLISGHWFKKNAELPKIILGFGPGIA
jgi:hypothetical protein